MLSIPLMLPILMDMTPTLTKWYEENGRHEIFAGGKEVPMASKDHRGRTQQERAEVVHTPTV